MKLTDERVVALTGIKGQKRWPQQRPFLTHLWSFFSDFITKILISVSHNFCIPFLFIERDLLRETPSLLRLFSVMFEEETCSLRLLGRYFSYAIWCRFAWRSPRNEEGNILTWMFFRLLMEGEASRQWGEDQWLDQPVHWSSWLRLSPFWRKHSFCSIVLSIWFDAWNTAYKENKFSLEFFWNISFRILRAFLIFRLSFYLQAAIVVE